MDKHELIFGIHPVMAVLREKKRRVLKVYIEETKHGTTINKIMKLAQKQGARVIRYTKEDIEKIVKGQNHQGVVLLAEPMSVLSLSDAIAMDATNKNALWLAVDEITDPQNLGAILRSAACFGVSTVILPGNRTASITPTVHKAACGALESLRIVSGGNLNSSLLKLQDAGFYVYGTDMDGTPLPEVEYNLPALIIISSEGTGIRRKTAEHCDMVVSIPQRGNVESLNAACAASVVLYDIVNKTEWL